MSTLIAIAGVHCAKLNSERLVESINLTGTLDIRATRSKNSYLAVGQHKSAPVYEKCILDTDKFSAILAGDIVNHSSMNWMEIQAEIMGLTCGKSALQKLQGAFTIALFDKLDQRLFVVTDAFSWQSVYVARLNGGIAVSTSLATFFNVGGKPPGVSRNWLYEHLYFNYGVLATTPLKGVDRLSAGNILEYRLKADQINITPYRKKPSSQANLLANQAGADEAKHIFNETVPEYFETDSGITISLSNGLDCRAILAAAPYTSLDGMSSLTFGLPNASEFLECAQIAEHLNFHHIPVSLDREFIKKLPTLIRETIYISNGLQNINRAHLLYAYSKSKRNGDGTEILLTGVSGDHIFRDHIRGMGNVPHIMSANFARQLGQGRHDLDSEDYREIVGNEYNDFRSYIEDTLDRLSNEYGDFRDPYFYLCYLMYEAGPRYFGGQLALANAFSTFRSPYWDSRIIELGFRLQDATLGFSSSMARRDRFKESQIQASIVAAHPQVSTLPYWHLPITVFSRGNKSEYQLHRGLRRLKAIFRGQTFIDTENWKLWYQTALNKEIQNLLEKNSRIREHVPSEFINCAIARADVHWLGKLATAELTLRHIENGWQRLSDQVIDER